MKVSSHYEDSSLAEKIGIVSNVSGNLCNVYLIEEERVIGITPDFLEPITPEKGNKVSFILKVGGALRDCQFTNTT